MLHTGDRERAAGVPGRFWRAGTGVRQVRPRLSGDGSTVGPAEPRHDGLPDEFGQ